MPFPFYRQMPNAKCQISKANKHNAKKRGEKKQRSKRKKKKANA